MTDNVNKLNDDAIGREQMDLRVLVVGGGFQYIKMFHEAGFKGATNVADADIICFTGGEDVDPKLYNERAIEGTYFNPSRDEYEIGIFGDAVVAQKPMVGICRGSQFLNVMNGGKLWQDVNNHTRGHSIIDLRDGSEKRGMTSTHHQMMRPTDEADIIAVAALATYKKAASEEELREADAVEPDDIEVVFYPATLSLCFQPHPEFSHGECRDFFLDLIDSYIVPAC